MNQKIFEIVPKLQFLNEDRLDLILCYIDSCFMVQSLEDNLILKNRVGELNGTNITKQTRPC